ncbi:MAG: hypothetical protein HY820_46035 [Acidobacteria bacterium]|nr:hypothetical protein [Acidobacteriota bacterium]
MADEIITALTRVPGLGVTARTSSFAFRGREQDVRRIGASLGVSAVLEGSVQRSGGRVRVSAQLVDTSNGLHLWSERFDREVADVFAIQDEISRAIAGALEVRLAPTPISRRTTSLEAYQLWLKGRYYHPLGGQLSLQATMTCKECYQQAIALDPSFPQPYLGLAELNRLVGYLGIAPAKEAGAKARVAIRKALELDDALGEAYALSGAYRAWLDFDWRGAEEDFDRAAALSPAAVDTHWLRTMVLLPHNRMREAVEEMERAIELDPLSPSLHSLFAWLLAFARDSNRALAESETALKLAPEHPGALGLRGSVLYFSDRIEEGVALWQSTAEKMARAPSVIAPLGYGLGLLGRKAEARAILAELDAAAKHSYVTPFSHALVHIGLGEFDSAFEWLDRAVDERDVHILHLTVKPVYDPIRSDPRFHALLRKMNLDA